MPKLIQESRDQSPHGKVYFDATLPKPEQRHRFVDFFGSLTATRELSCFEQMTGHLLQV
jgi:hypothetical protein